MKIVFLTFYCEPQCGTATAWLEKIKTFAALAEGVGKKCNTTYIKQIGCEERFSRDNVEYIFLNCKQKKSLFPVRMLRLVKQLNPDIIILSGIRSPLQIMLLRWKLGKKVKIIGRHHHDRPPDGIRRILQRFVDRCFNAYLFTSLGNAQEWFDAGIIEKDKKIYELIEASTGLSKLDKENAKQITCMTGKPTFLWVSRLNKAKDPFTVLKGFENYILTEPGARLYMIFDVIDLLPEVKKIIEQSAGLKKTVSLVGFISNDELPAWYSAADFYISGSHSEGGSYALLEAMACGCIPIVTAIPAALKMTGDGRYGIIFQPGNVNDLINKLAGLSSITREEFSASVENYFNKELSTTAIAEKLYGYCRKLAAE